MSTMSIVVAVGRQIHADSGETRGGKSKRFGEKDCAAMTLVWGHMQEMGRVETR